MDIPDIIIEKLTILLICIGVSGYLKKLRIGVSVRKCVMVDREMSFPYTVGSGSMYVTDRWVIMQFC